MFEINCVVQVNRPIGQIFLFLERIRTKYIELNILLVVDVSVILSLSESLITAESIDSVLQG